MTNETAATGGVMYTNEGELEFDEDEMAALEGQRLVVGLFPDFRSLVEPLCFWSRFGAVTPSFRWPD